MYEKEALKPLPHIESAWERQQRYKKYRRWIGTFMIILFGITVFYLSFVGVFCEGEQGCIVVFHPLVLATIISLMLTIIGFSLVVNN